MRYVVPRLVKDLGEVGIVDEADRSRSYGREEESRGSREEEPVRGLDSSLKRSRRLASSMSKLSATHVRASSSQLDLKHFQGIEWP